MKKFEVIGHEESYLPEGREWELVWSDEFDKGTLDREKWSFRLHMAGKRHNCWIEDAVSFEGSSIIFHLVEKDGKYYSSALQTAENFTDRPNGESKSIKPKFLHKRGYYECRAKLQKEMPWWSAFWIQSQTVALGGAPEEAGVEADIMESFSPGNIIPQMNHWGGYTGDAHKCINSAGKDKWLSGIDEIPVTLDEFHRFGLEWDESGYTFYVDGKVCGQKIKAPVSDTEQFINLSTECKGERGAIDGYTGPMEFESGIKDMFVVDYVRVFDRK